MYTALRNNVCFADGASEATKVEFPSVTYYNSFDSCSGSVSNKETVNADVCEAPTGTYDDNTEFSSFKISLIGERWSFLVSLFCLCLWLWSWKGERMKLAVPCFHIVLC